MLYYDYLMIFSVLLLQKRRINSRFVLVLLCMIFDIYLLYRFKLKTAEAIRRWIPDIKKDIDYCIQQVFI